MIELYYNTNTCRKRIAEIEPKEIDVSNPSGVLLKIYQEKGILKNDPFAILDQQGVDNWYVWVQKKVVLPNRN